MFRRPLATAALLALALPLLAAAPAGSTAGTPTHIDYTLSAAQIKANCARELSQAAKVVSTIVAAPAGKRSFTSVVLPLESLAADLNDNLVAETLLFSVSTDRGVRDASQACQNNVNDFFTALTARPELYRAVREVAAGKTAKTEADRKVTDLWLVAIKRSGAGLDAPKRKQFVALTQKLNAVQTDFGANLGNDKTTILLSPAQLTGLPEDLVATFTKKDTDYVVPVNEGTARFLEDAADGTARKAYYLAYNNRAVAKNVPLLKSALVLRSRLAHLLGYHNWAEYILADHMAATPARVIHFLDDLDSKIIVKARAEVADLAALKAKDAGSAAALEPWDITYYDNQLRKTKYAVDNNEVRQYFPVDHVERAVFDIYSKILGVSFAARTTPNLWNPEVTEWTVTDTATGRYIGDFYLDLFPREGKYSHFASFPLLPVRRLADGSMRPPQDAIIGNWPRPAPGKPALLSHGDVETFFHEFGHDMATMLATAPYETLSSGFRSDFVEAPSQMLENWVWDPSILKKLSARVDTGAPLPDDLIAKIRASRYVNNAYFTTRQIMLSEVDMAYHMASNPHLDTTAVWARVASEKTPLALPPGVHPEAQFGHIMGGYDAGYYGYLWSKVYAQDMFSAFAGAGLESAVVGARYRHDILEPARQLEPDVEVRNFLGRSMNPAAFYREFGIDAPVANAER